MGVGYDSDQDTVEECPLADDLRLVAKQELREDDVIRTHSLRAMRNWIRKHPDIVNCRTGNVFTGYIIRVHGDRFIRADLGNVDNVYWYTERSIRLNHLTIYVQVQLVGACR